MSVTFFSKSQMEVLTMTKQEMVVAQTEISVRQHVEYAV